MYTGFLWGRLNKIGHFEGLGTDGEIILKWILNTSEQIS